MNQTGTKTWKKRGLESVLKSYRTIVVVGANWGDEGKGKIIDLVMDYYDIAVRFSGGANAGHTVKTPAGVKLVSHLIPCGLTQNKTCVLGRGELVDLRLFVEEFRQAKTTLLSQLPDVWLDEMSPVWTPWHAMLEDWLETVKGSGRVGTTGKGIGPLEGLFKLRISPVVGHLFLGQGKLTAILTPLYEALLPVLERVRDRGKEDIKIPKPQEVAKQLLDLASEIKDKISDTSYFLDQALKNRQRILFEGAQALGLDSHWGTYPYVSSGNSAAAGAAIGTGLPMSVFEATLMVVKTLPTRVGGGPFVSEMWRRQEAQNFAKEHNELFKEGEQRSEFLSARLFEINEGQAAGAELSRYFQVLGDERGATTGRGRSVGFLDIPWLLYAIRVNGPKFLALTRFDMLSQVKNIPVVTAYKLDGQVLGAGKMPPSWRLGEVEPVFEQWPCWEENIYGLSEEERLPEGAKDFLAELERRLKVPILLVGTGPKREHIIVRTGQAF